VSTLTKKVLTSLATAGLLAGLLGSALIPVARAASFSADEDVNGADYYVYTVLSDNSAVLGNDYVECGVGDYPGYDNNFDNAAPDALSAADACAIFSPASVDEGGDAVEDDSTIEIDLTSNGGLVYTSGSTDYTVATEDIEWTVTSTGDALVDFGADSCPSGDPADYSTLVDSAPGDSDDYMYICVIPKSMNASGTGTVTLKAEHAGKTSTLQTFYFDFIGPVKTITPTKLVNLVATDTNNWSTVAALTFKDAAGTDMGDILDGEDIVSCLGDEFSDTGDDACDVADDNQLSVDFIIDGDYVENDWNAGDTNAYLDIDGSSGPYVQLYDICDEQGTDAGDTVSVQTFLNADYDERLDSNEIRTAAWTVKCTGGRDGAYISDISTADVAQKASTLAVDRTLDLVVSLKDENDQPLGYLGDGASIGVSGDLTLDFEDNADFVVEPDSNLDITDLEVLEGKGYADLSDVTAPEAYTLTVGDATYMGWNTMDFIVSDPTYDGDGDETTWSVDYRVTAKIVNIVVTGKTACATFGLKAAGKQITFLVEYTKAGVEKVVYRYGVANSKGKACYTVLGANRTITAIFGSDASDTKTVK